MYKPGKELYIANALSCAYLHEQKENLLEEDLAVNWITSQLPILEQKLDAFKKATGEDAEMQMLKKAVLTGWVKERSMMPRSI